MSYNSSWTTCETYVSLEVIYFNIRFDPNQVAEHPRHHILPEHNNFLAKELDTAWVARKIYFRYLCLQACCKTGKYWAPWKDGGRARIVRTRNEYKMAFTSDYGIRCY
jgi:hypothetical protein